MTSPKPSSSLPYLEPEIWDRVLFFVKHPRPIGGTPTKWKGLHQGDLASLMRVNSAMNEIAGRHLYHSVVTDDLQLFAAGLEDSHNVPNRISLTKVHILGYTKRLYLEDRLWEIVGKDWKEVDLFNRVQWAKRNEERPSFSFPFLNDTFQQAARTLMLQQGAVLQFFIHLGQGQDSPFRNLETISFHSYSKLLFVWNRAEGALFEIFYHRGSKMGMRAWIDTLPRLRVVCRQLAWGTMTDGGFKEPQAFVCECGYDYQGMSSRHLITCWHTYRPESCCGLLIPYERNMTNLLYSHRHPYAEGEFDKEKERTDAFHMGDWINMALLASQLRKTRHDRATWKGKWVWGHRYVESEYPNLKGEDDEVIDAEHTELLGHLQTESYRTKFAEPDNWETTTDISKDAIRMTIVNYCSIVPNDEPCLVGEEEQLAFQRNVRRDDPQEALYLMISRLSPQDQVVYGTQMAQGMLEIRQVLKDKFINFDMKHDKFEVKSFLEVGDCEACGGPGDVDKWLEAIKGDMEVDRKTKAELSRPWDDEEDKND